MRSIDARAKLRATPCAAHSYEASYVLRTVPDVAVRAGERGRVAAAMSRPEESTYRCLVRELSLERADWRDQLLRSAAEHGCPGAVNSYALHVAKHAGG